MALATAATKDPDDWKLRIFAERSNPWEQFLADVVVDTSPIVNVWFDSSTFPEGQGDTIERQTSESIFNIDCYGYGISADNPAGGHFLGDNQAATEAHRAMRLVRNILMSSVYIVLELQGVVGQRWTQSRTSFQPEQNGQAIQNVVGSRIAFRVKHNELSPQGDETNILEKVAVDLKRESDGQRSSRKLNMITRYHKEI
jgi:hypothetical protein